MNAFRALGRGVVPEAESAWLFKIAENVCLSRRRSSWRRGKIESPSDFGVIEEIVPGPNRQRDELIGIEDALASMPEQQRRAILLREWQGLSYREIADELDVSQSAVETLIFRARRSLAQGLEQPDSVKPAKRKSFRRALHALDLGTVVAALKTLLAGSAAVKATAAAVAVTAAAGTAVTVAPQPETKAPVKRARQGSRRTRTREPLRVKSFSIASTAGRDDRSPRRSRWRPRRRGPPRRSPFARPFPAPLPSAPAPPRCSQRAARRRADDACRGAGRPAGRTAEQPVAEQQPMRPAPATAEQPKHEHVTPQPAPEPAKNEGKNEGKSKRPQGHAPRRRR